MNNLITANSINILDVDNDIKDINIRQQTQDDEILVNLMASVDIYEMMLNLFAVQTFNIKDKKIGGDTMAEVYVTLILKGKKTIDQVPELVRPQVEAMLKQLM